MKKAIVGCFVLALTLGWMSSSASAMTWAAKYIEDPAGGSANSVSECAFAYGAAGYLNASKFDGWTCFSNATTSAYDTNLSSDYFRTNNAGITSQVTSTTAWRNQRTVSYTVYNATKCGGGTLSLPAASGTVSTAFSDWSVAQSGWAATCQA